MISFVFILFFIFPVSSPADVISSYIFSNCSAFSIFISIFQIKFDDIPININISNKNPKNIFLFLYLLNKNGNPFFLIIFTLHFVFFAIFFIFLKSFIPIFRFNRTLLSLFKFHIIILLFLHILINLSM